MARTLWRYSDGTTFESYDRIYNDHGERTDGTERVRARILRTRPLACGAAEGWDARTLLGQPCKRGTLRRIIAATDENRTRTERKRIMEAARRRVAADRKREREAAEVILNRPPLELLNEDVREGRLPQAFETVTETRKLDLGDRHYVTFEMEAAGYLVQLERLHGDYSSSRRMSESVMRHEDRKGGNVKASRPWKRSRWTTTLYLTDEDLQKVSDAANGSVEVLTENSKGITCVRYSRNRGWRVEAIVKRHLREAASRTA